MKFSEEEHNLYRELHASKQYQLEAHDRSYALMQELATCRATLETLGKITNTEKPKSIEFREDDASIIIDEVIGEIRERSHAIVMALAEAVKDEKAAKKAEKEAERARIKAERDAEKARIKQEKEDLFNSLEVGQKRHGKVTKLMPYGAFVDIGGLEGLVHLNNLSWEKVESVEDMLSEGQEVQVYVLDIDKENK